MKNSTVTTILTAALFVTAFTTPVSAATKVVSDNFYENQWYTGRDGWIYSPFSLYATHSVTYTDQGDATIQVTRMETTNTWKNYKAYSYTGYPSVGSVNWYSSGGSSVGSYGLTNYSSMIYDPADYASGKYWSGTIAQLKGNYTIANFSWTCTGSGYPGGHDESLSLYF